MRLRFGGLRGGAPKPFVRRTVRDWLRSSSASAGSGHWPVSDSPDLVPVSDSAVPAPVADSADTDPAGEAGKLSVEEKKKQRAKQKREYRKTPEGKAKAKASREKYSQSAKGKAAASKYSQSAKGKAVAKKKASKFAQSAKGKAVVKMITKKYCQSAKGKAVAQKKISKYFKKPVPHARRMELQQNARLKEKERSVRPRVQYARASRDSEVSAADGTWTQAAAKIAQAECTEPAPFPGMPPSYCALNDEESLQAISEMYSFLESTVWRTCVVCWRAWYSVNFDHRFPSLVPDDKPWFQPRDSVYMRTRHVRKRVNHWVMDFEIGQEEAAEQFLRQNYPDDTARHLLATLVGAGRGICICKSCQPHVEDGQLQPYIPSGIPGEAPAPRLCDYAVDPVKVCARSDTDGTTTYGGLFVQFGGKQGDLVLRRGLSW